MLRPLLAALLLALVLAPSAFAQTSSSTPPADADTGWHGEAMPDVARSFSYRDLEPS